MFVISYKYFTKKKQKKKHFDADILYIVYFVNK